MPREDGASFRSQPVIGDDRYEVTRRLSDKILSAFNHAYAMGEVEIAQRLRSVLMDNETVNGGAAEKRGGHDPLGQADRWVAFVEARNQYKWACENHGADPGAVDEALDAMKEAYRHWTDS